MVNDTPEVEQRLATLAAARDRALAEAELLSAIAALAAGEDELDGILTTALNQLGRVIPFTGGSIALVEGDELVLRAAAGPFAAQALGQRQRRGAGRMWQLVETGAPLLSADLAAEGLHATTPIRSYLAVPLAWRNERFGVLEVDSTRAGAFDTDDLRLLQRVALALSGPIQLVRRHAAEAKALDEADAARQRFVFLSDASVLLAGSLDYDTTLAQVTRLAVPALADWCLCDVAESDGSFRRVAVVCADARRRSLARTLLRYPPLPQRGEGVERVFATGLPILVPAVTDTFLQEVTQEETGAPERLRLARRVGARSVMLVPLVARGRTLAVLSFVLTQSERRYGPADLALAEELARRAGLAADNALLYREAQQALAERDRALVYAEAERDRLQQVVEVLPAAVLIAGPDHRIAISNGVARALLGEEMSGRSLAHGDAPSTILHLPDGEPVPVAELPLQRAVFRGESVRGEQYLVRGTVEGREVPLLISSEPLRDPSGAPAGGMAVFQDITPIKEFERARDEFLSSVTHDLRTPLTAIHGFAQLLQRRAERERLADVAWLGDGLTGIQSSTAKINDLINELLDVGRLQMGRPLDLDRRPLDLVRLVRDEVTARQQTAANHQIVVEAETSKLVGLWDRRRLERVLGNLLANAIKYSPEGGMVSVRVAREETPDGASAVLVVQDEGVGIPANDLPHVFERFYRGTNVRRRFEGMGIGLASIKQIVEQHGGTVEVRNRRRKGTVFTVRLPLSGGSGDLFAEYDPQV